MKRALIVLTLELALLGVAVAAYLADESPAVRWPPAVATAARPSTPAASRVVPVSISLMVPMGTVETAALTRGGHARRIGAGTGVKAASGTVRMRTTGNGR
jgi:hypothetical protein